MSEIGYIDGILSTHFNECSIASADVAKAAQEVWVTEEPIIARTVQPIGRYRTLGVEDFEFIDLLDLDYEHDKIAGSLLKLALARHPAHEDLPIGLVAIFNHDLMLPLATFESRTNGQCSYVQIGQEIDEDKLVATEGATRTDQVELIRTLVKDKKADVASIGRILEEEFDQHSLEIAELSMPAVCRLAEQYCSDARSELDIQLYNPETEDFEQTYILGAPITVVGTGKSDKPHGHEVRLFIGRQQSTVEQVKREKRRFGKDRVVTQQTSQPTGPIRLVACIRGNIAIELASFDSESGTVSAGGYDKPATLDTLLPIISVLSSPDDLRGFSRRIKRHFYNAKQKDETNLCFERTGGARPTDVVASEHTSTHHYNGYYGKWYFNIANIHDWNTFITEFNPQWSREPDLELHAKQAVQAGRDIAKLLESLNLGTRLERLFDSGDTPQEIVIKQVLSKLSMREVVFTGVLTDRKAGRTTTDVETKIQLRGEKKQVKVNVEGRPVAMEGFPPATLFDETLRLDGKNKDESTKFKEISDVIGAICISDT